MFKNILLPVDVGEIEVARPAIDIACEHVKLSDGKLRLLNVLSLTPVMLAEYVPPDFDLQQRQAAEAAMSKLCTDCRLAPDRVSAVVRQGGIYHEILQEAEDMGADLIVMSSHRPAMKTYFLGSNAGHVVRYAKCSVLVFRR